MDPKIIICGGAGFVGRNLLAQLRSQDYKQIIILDKNEAAVAELRAACPDYSITCVDLANNPEEWEHYFKGADIAIMLQAQIGGHTDELFTRNNITSTRHVLQALKKHAVPYLIHVSSSVIKQEKEDRYSRTKKLQEQLVLENGIPYTILRPTLMFGPFNVNHFAWLACLMRKAHVMPVPGNGKYIRQPLYAPDFCQIIMSCIQTRLQNKIFNISGLEQIYYIDCLRMIRSPMKIFCPIIIVPYPLFKALITLWTLINKKANFNTEQLQALCAGDVFEVIDWPAIFGVKTTPSAHAFRDTFCRKHE